MKSRTITFLKAILLAAISAPIIVPAYGQQEVDPTWYNPWPDAPKPAAKPALTKIAEHKEAKTIHKDQVSATQTKKKQAAAQQPVRTVEALPPVKK
jgi:hypothetical protein